MAGAISCLATNVFTKKGVKPCFPIFFMTMADFFLTKGAWPNRPSLMCNWRPGIDGES